MKKQLSIIVSFVLLAFFANVAKADNGCVSTNGLTPSANVPYTYVVDVAASAQYNGDGHYHWYITQNTNLLDAGSIIAPGTFFTVNPGSDYNIPFNSPGTTSNSLGLTWVTAATGQTFYLVLRYQEQNDSIGSPDCKPENIRVWEIIPNEATNFVLAITGSNALGDSLVDASGCAGVVESAIIQTLTSKVQVIYAPNNLYYLVKASGASTTWNPSILLPDISANATYEQHYGSAQWASLTDLDTWHDFNLPVAGSTGGAYTSSTSAPVTEDGSYILIKVQLNNRMYETLANQPFELAVDGVLSGTNQKDIWGDDRPDGTNFCDDADDWARKATYTIIARPTVNPGAGMGPFMTQLPN